MNLQPIPIKTLRQRIADRLRDYGLSHAGSDLRVCDVEQASTSPALRVRFAHAERCLRLHCVDAASLRRDVVVIEIAWGDGDDLADVIDALPWVADDDFAGQAA